MKIKLVCLTLIIGFSLSLNKAKVESETMMVESTTYALAKEQKLEDFYVKNSDRYNAKIEFVDHLPPSQPITGGTVETVEELPSGNNEYYDGTRGMKITTTQCQSYTSKREVCLGQGSCGWCGSSNSCIHGNNLGPLSPCLRGQYFFSDPNFIPQSGVVSQTNILGAQLTKVVVN